jgi:hypothetical protein
MWIKISVGRRSIDMMPFLAFQTAARERANDRREKLLGKRSAKVFDGS